MSILAGFADISLGQLLLVAAIALFASLIGGLAGYGTGALMPLVLVPLVGAEPVVPIIAISAVFTNISRFTAYFRYIDRRRALIVVAAAALTTALGAYGYTRLTNAGAALVIGTMLISSVPLRRLAKRREVRIGDSGLAASAVGYGVVVGGTSGSGVILLSLLMAAGLEGAAVIATDAVISVATSVIKISVFGLAGVVTAQVLAFALLIGIIAIPGAFLARAFVERMPVHIHTAILDAAVITGGVVMISTAARSLLYLFGTTRRAHPDTRSDPARAAAGPGRRGGGRRAAGAGPPRGRGQDPPARTAPSTTNTRHRVTVWNRKILVPPGIWTRRPYRELSRHLTFLVAVVLILFVVVFGFVLILFVLRIVHFGKFEHDFWQRFAKQIALAAHPQALRRVVVDFRHGNRVTAGFQNDNIAWFQFHDLFPPR